MDPVRRRWRRRKRIFRDGNRVFHTYSAYTRGVEQLFGTYQWLDLTPLGRQQHVAQIPHHDVYETES